jgi:putative PEP-CTERM system TPR-repeat lipoprotein
MVNGCSHACQLRATLSGVGTSSYDCTAVAVLGVGTERGEPLRVMGQKRRTRKSRFAGAWSAWPSIMIALGIAGNAIAATQADQPTPAQTNPASPDSHVAALLQSANEALKADNLNLALIQLKTAVRLAPKNGAVRARLGLALLKAGASVTAIRELRQARADGGPEEILVPAILDAMLIRGETKELLNEFPEPTEGTRDKTAPDVLRARALALQTLGQAQDAQVEIDRSLALRRDATGLISRAMLARQDGNTALARNLAEEAQALSPKSEDVLMFRVSLLRQTGEAQKALVAVDAFANAQPRSAIAQGLRIEVLLDLKRDGEARAEIDTLAQLVPDSPLPTYYRALLASRARDIRGAWHEAQTLQPEFVLLQPSIALNVAQMAIANGELDTGRAILAALVSRHPELSEARLRLAMVQLTQHNADLALKTLTPLLGVDDPETQALLAQAYIALHRFGDAISALEKATSVAGGSDKDYLKSQLALSALAYGDTARAIQDLEPLAAREPESWDIAAPLIASLVRARRFDEALSVADRAAQHGDKTPLSGFYRGQILMIEGDLGAAAAAFGEAIAADSKFLPALYYRAKVSIARGHWDRAGEDLRHILESDPANIPAYIKLAQIALDEGRDSEVLDLLGRAIKTAPTEPAPRLALANYRMLRGQYREAQSVLTTLLTIARDNPQALALQGQLQFTTGERAQAIDTFRALAAENPPSSEAFTILAKALHATNDRFPAVDAARQAAALAPFSVPAQALLAELLVAAGRPDDALAGARAFRLAHPGPGADLLVADTLIRLNRTNEASALLQEQLRVKPDSVLALRLSRLDATLGDADQARAVLERWLSKNPRDFDVRREYASLLLQSGDRTAAQKEFETLLKRRPEDPVVLNDLAWILQDDDLPRALSLGALAAKIVPSSPTILDTLGWMKFKAGEQPKALALLKRAHDLATGDGEIAYHFAVALASVGRKGEAKSLLQSIIQKNVEFADKDEARGVLASW